MEIEGYIWMTVMSEVVEREAYIRVSMRVQGNPVNTPVPLLPFPTGPKLPQICAAMYHLKVPVLLLMLLMLLQCVTTAPNNRYSISSTEQVDEAEGWMPVGLSSNPFLEFVRSRPQRGLSGLNSQRHHIEKRRCNTATCVTQRLADFLVRSSNTFGTVYAPTNVGSSTYGKRDTFQSPNSVAL